MNRKRWLVLMSVMLVGVLMTSMASVRAQVPVTPAATDEPLRTITVGGQGEARVEPDLAVMQFGVEVRADTAAEAFEQAGTQMEDVLAALIDAGVPQDEIQTQAIRLNPQLVFPTGPEPGVPELVGFAATNIVEVRLAELERVGEILSIAVEAGANVVQSISFRVSDQGAVLDEALEAAFRNAEARAQTLAAMAGAELGEVLHVVSDAFAPVPFGLGGAQLDIATAPIAPGLESVVALVQVTWSLRDVDDLSVTPTPTPLETPTMPAPAAPTPGTPTPGVSPVQTPAPGVTPTPTDAAEAAREALAEELDIATDDVSVILIEQVDWADACLELAEPDELCAQVITPGWRILLRAEGRFYMAHTDLESDQVRFAGQ